MFKLMEIFVIQEDIKSLCAHIVETHMKELESVNYVSTFNSLKMRYEQQQDGLKDKLFDRYVVKTIIEKEIFETEPYSD